MKWENLVVYGRKTVGIKKYKAHLGKKGER